MRDEASPPRNEARMLVGGDTMLCTVPKAPLFMSSTGGAKFGWLKALNICTPTPSSPRSQRGIFVFFITEKSVLKKPEDRKLFLSPLLPNPVSVPAAGNALTFK